MLVTVKLFFKICMAGIKKQRLAATFIRRKKPHYFK